MRGGPPAIEVACVVNVLDAIGSLRVVRRYAERPLEPAHLEAILRAGRRASSSKNRQRWDFVVVTGRDGLRALSEVGPYAGHVAEAAAAVALVYPNPSGEAPHSTNWDLGPGIPEHDPRRLVARDRELPDHRLRAGAGPTRSSATRPTMPASSSSPSATRPIPTT